MKGKNRTGGEILNFEEVHMESKELTAGKTTGEYFPADKQVAMTKPKTTLDYAKMYLNKGFSIIPLKPKDKRPAIPSWKEYQHRRPTDEELVKWFGNESQNNIGIVTGAISRLAVVDLDSKEAVEFAKENDFPLTPLVKTGKDYGYHAYYKYREGVRNFQKRDDLPGIDLRGDGGYVVAPPSIHPSGHQYQWVDGKGLDNIPLADLPETILVKNPQDKTSLRELYKGVERGGRNDSLARLTGSWVNDGLTFKECLEMAFLWNSKNDPPLPEKEVEATVKSIFERHHSKKATEELVVRQSKRGIRSVKMEHEKKEFRPRDYTEIILKLYPSLFYECREGAKFPKGRMWGHLAGERTWRRVENEIRQKLRTEIMEEKHWKSFFVEEVMKDLAEVTWKPGNPEQPHWRYINLKNGIWDILKGDFVGESGDETADLFFIQQLPYGINPKHTTCPTIDKLLHDWGGDWDIALKELIGYTLIRDYPYQKFFFLYGEGWNGKSKYIQLIQRFLGKGNFSSVSLEQILHDKFMRPKLFGKLANLVGETAVKILQKTEILKNLTGGDTIVAEEKFKAPFEFLNYAKMIFMTNTIPPTTDKTEAFYRRVYIIRFPNVFKVPIPDLITRIPDEEFEGLLYILLHEIIPGFIQRGYTFSIDPPVEELKKDWEELSNPLPVFIKRNFVEDYDGYVPKPVFRELFNRYCMDNKIAKSFEVGSVMRKEYPDGQKVLKPEEIERWKAISGIKLPERCRIWRGLKLLEQF